MTTDKKQNLSAMARAKGLPEHVVLQRVNRLGWDVERALNTPVRKNKRTLRVADDEIRVATTTEKSSLSFLNVRKLSKREQFTAIAVILAIILWAVNA